MKCMMKLISCSAFTFTFLIAFTAAGSDVKHLQRLLKPLDDDDDASPRTHKQIQASPLLSLHRDLIEIESTTGNEYHVGNYLTAYLKSYNFTVDKQTVSNSKDPQYTVADQQPFPHERFNVLAYRGNERNTRTLVTSHIDTVPPYWPYDVRNGGTDIWGRGSVDAKGSVATQIRAVVELFDAHELRNTDVALLFVVGEETGGDGMRAVNSLNMSWETVIFGEPTDLKLASGHKGNLAFTLVAHGKAGHSGYPELFVNANSLLIPALSALENMHLPSSEKYGNSTLNIGYIQGGVAGNVIPGEAHAIVHIRIASGTAEEMKNRVLDVIESVSEGKVKVNFLNEGYGTIHIDADVEGFETMTVNYGTDIPNLNGSHKRYLYGPGSILRAHSDREHLSVGDLEQAVEGYKALIRASIASKCSTQGL